jgi:hypothetical protein
MAIRPDLYPWQQVPESQPIPEAEHTLRPAWRGVAQAGLVACDSAFLQTVHACLLAAAPAGLVEGVWLRSGDH